MLLKIKKLKRSFLETQKLEHEKEKKLEIIENQFLAEKKRLENQLIEINKVYELKLIENDKELEDEIQNKDESYLTIKKTHTQTSVRLNNFINKVKQEFLDKKEQLNNEFFFKIEKIDEQILRKKEIFEKNKDKIQHLYLEKLKALNVVFDVQKSSYNTKASEIIQKNNEAITAINKDLRIRREQLQKEIDLLEKEKWKELSKTKDLDLRTEINKKYAKQTKLLNNQILMLIKNNEDQLIKQEIHFQTELFNHDYDHIGNINEWRYSKNLYETENKNNILIEKAKYEHEIYILEQRKLLEKEILDLNQDIQSYKLEKSLLPIESQLMIASYLQNREINLLNVEFETIKYNYELNNKLALSEKKLEDLKVEYDLKILESKYEYDKRVIIVNAQLEIEKVIIKRDNTLKMLDENIKLQNNLLKQKNDRYYQIFEGTLKHEALTIEKLNKDFAYQSRNLTKTAKIEHEKRNAILQEIKHKNNLILNTKKIKRTILIAKNEAELREKINRYFLDQVMMIITNQKEIINSLEELIKIPAHPETIRQTINLIIKYLDIELNTIKKIAEIYIEEDKKEFENRLFSLTDHKYRIKHEEILNFYNDAIKTINEKLIEVNKKINYLQVENSNAINTIKQHNLLIQSHKNNKSLDETIKKQLLLLKEEIDSLTLKTNNNNKIIKNLNKQIIPLEKSLQKYQNAQLLDEKNLEKEKKFEESKYNKIFNKHYNKYNNLITYLNNYYNNIKNLYLNFIKTPYFSDQTFKQLISKLNNNFSQYKDLVIIYNDQLLSFWLKLYLRTKNEQTNISTTFNRSAKLAIKQSKKSFNNFILMEEKEQQIYETNYLKESKILEDTLKNASNNMITSVKSTHDVYNKIYSDAETKIYNNNQETNYKLTLINENLEGVLTNLNENYINSLNKIKKDFDTKTNIVLKDINNIKRELENNIKRNNLKTNAIINRYNIQKEDNIEKMKHNHKRLLNLIQTSNRKIEASKKYYRKRIFNNNVKTKQNIKLIEYDFKTYKVKSRKDQNRLTRKERNVLKKSYRFKKKEILANKK